jgi:hypothetical protein
MTTNNYYSNSEKEAIKAKSQAAKAARKAAKAIENNRPASCLETENNSNTPNIPNNNTTTMTNSTNNSDISANFDNSNSADNIQTNAPESSAKTDCNDVNNIHTNNNKETTMTTSTNSASTLTNYGLIANTVITQIGDVSVAEIFASMVYATKEYTPFSGESQEQQAEMASIYAAKNAAVVSSIASFVANFSNMGALAPVELIFSAKSLFQKTMTPAVKKNLEHFFTLQTKKSDDTTTTGRAPVKGGVQLYVDHTDAALLLASVVAKAIEALSPADIASLIGLLFSNATVENCSVSFQNIVFNFEEGTVVTVSLVNKVNKFTSFGRMTYKTSFEVTAPTVSEFIVFPGLTCLALLAMQSGGGSTKELSTAINLAVPMFAPVHNYGHKPDSDDIAFFVRENLVYTASVLRSNASFPSFRISAGKQSPDLLGYAYSKGIIAGSDKTNTKFITINEGAQALGWGYDAVNNLLRTPNDTNKVSKLPNRPASLNYDCADLPNRVASNFGFALMNGKVARTKGSMKKTAFTNSLLLNAGSGTGTIHPDSTFVFSLEKTLSFVVPFSALGVHAPTFLNNEINQNIFIKRIVADVKAKVGVVYHPNEAILFAGQLVLASNTEACSDVTLLGATVTRNVLDNNEININLKVRLQGESQFVKTRRAFTKFTTTPYNVEGLSQPWEIVLNTECTKGQGALLEMFANETGERFLNTATGEFTTPSGDVINLLEEGNAFLQWKAASTKVETIEIVMAKSVYKNISQFCPNEFTIVSETETTITVQETIEVIYGSLVYDVEISTPRESVSTSNMTLESASAVYTQSAKLGTVLFNEILYNTATFSKLANQFAHSNPLAARTIDLNSAAGSLKFQSKLVGIHATSTAREVFAAASKAFPEGISIKVGTIVSMFDFTVCSAFGAFNPINGAAIRENGQIFNMLVDILGNQGANASTLVPLAEKAFGKILSTSVDSKNTLKRATRAGNLVYGKVRTGQHPILHSVDGIPTIVLNSACPMVRLLGIKTGDLVGFARTPMPFLGAGRVVLTDDNSICDIAHVLLDPFVFHSLCEGDSDGDGIALINLSKGATQITTEEAVEINNSLMGMGGYAHLYGTNLPYADFMSVKDKYSKKAMSKSSTFLSSTVANPDSETQEQIALTPKVFCDYCERVANHYKSKVGTGYGICSKLVFHAADEAANGPSVKLTQITEACLIAWRIIYEGLGLSGYSREANEVYNILECASVDTKALQVSLVGNTVDVIFNDPTWKTTKDNCVSGASVLAATSTLSSFNVDLNVYNYLIAARQVTRVISKLEGFSKPLNSESTWWDGVVPQSIKYGTLRRISQGDDRVSELLSFEEEADFAMSGEMVPMTMTRRFLETTVVEEAFSNALLGKVVENVASFHATIAATKASLKYVI